MKSKFITSGIPRAMSCSITPAKLHLRRERTQTRTGLLTRWLNTVFVTHPSGKPVLAVPLDLWDRHGDEVVKFLLGVETVAGARVLSAGPAGPLPGLGFGDPLHCQHLQPAV